MSIRHMSAVWDDPYFSQGDKATLLVALALADSARSEDGRAWPSIEKIARKARTSIRGAQDACRKMENDGKLKVEVGAGPHRTNMYSLLWTPQPLHPAMAAPRKRAPEKPAEIPAPDCTQSVRNGKEPSGTPPEIPPTPRHDSRWFPENLRSAEFKNLFAEWEEHSREAGKPLTSGSRRGILSQCAEHGEAVSSEAIRVAMAKNWKSIIWDHSQNHSKNANNRQSESDRDRTRTGIESSAGEALKRL